MCASTCAFLFLSSKNKYICFHFMPFFPFGWGVGSGGGVWGHNYGHAIYSFKDLVIIIFNKKNSSIELVIL